VEEPNGRAAAGRVPPDPILLAPLGDRVAATRRSGDRAAEMDPVAAGLTVLLITLAAVYGPAVGISPWWITLLTLLALGGLSLDAARFGGRGGHLLAEALPGGRLRLRRIAIHEAGHCLVAEAEQVPVHQVLVGTLACLRAGVSGSGTTALVAPGAARLPLQDLRRWSRVLQAGMVAEALVYGEEPRGGADDRALLGQLWGLSGFDVDTAQREQRQARREVEKLLRQELSSLEARAETLLQAAPRLGRPSVTSAAMGDALEGPAGLP